MESKKITLDQVKEHHEKGNGLIVVDFDLSHTIWIKGGITLYGIDKIEFAYLDQLGYMTTRFIVSGSVVAEITSMSHIDLVPPSNSTSDTHIWFHSFDFSQSVAV